MNFGTFFVLLQFLWIVVNAIEFTVEPKLVKDLQEEDVHLSCIPRNLQTMPFVMIRIIIYRHGNILASINDGRNSKPAESSVASNIGNGTKEVHGQLESVAKNSYLNVTLFQQDSCAAGEYECEVAYMDYAGEVKKERQIISLERKKLNPGILKIVDELKQKVEDLEKNRKDLQTKAFNSSLTVTKLNNLFQVQAKASSNQIKRLKDLLQNKTESAEVEIFRLNEQIRKRTQASDERILDLREMLENQRNMVKQNEERFKKLQNVIDIERKANNRRIMELQKLLEIHQDLITTKAKTERDMNLSKRIDRLEKTELNLNSKMHDLQTTTSMLERKLNETKDGIEAEMTNFSSKDDIRHLRERISNQTKNAIDDINKKFIIVSLTETNDKNSLLQILSDNASTAEFKKLFDKQSSDVSLIKQIYHQIVTQQISSAQKIDQRIRELENSKGGLGKNLTVQVNELCSDLRQIMTNVTDYSKITHKLESDINHLLQLSLSLSARFKKTEARRLQYLNDLKKFIKSNTNSAHVFSPPSNSTTVAADKCIGKIGFDLVRCLADLAP